MAKPSVRKKAKLDKRREMARELARSQALILELDVKARTLEAELRAARAVIEAKEETIVTLNKFSDLANKVAQLEGFTLGRERSALAQASEGSPQRRRWRSRSQPA
jgi:predicted GTPase